MYVHSYNVMGVIVYNRLERDRTMVNNYEGTILRLVCFTTSHAICNTSNIIYSLVSHL